MNNVTGLYPYTQAYQVAIKRNYTANLIKRNVTASHLTYNEMKKFSLWKEAIALTQLCKTVKQTHRYDCLTALPFIYTHFWSLPVRPSWALTLRSGITAILISYISWPQPSSCLISLNI